jgi:uncharacterized protein YbjT (DUF2867 family)
MKILLTGANGYVGQRLLPLLLEAGHEVCALVRSSKRLLLSPAHENQVKIITADLLDKESLQKIPKNLDAAYYLVHSLATKESSLIDTEARAAKNFLEALEKTTCQQIIYLGGIATDSNLSPHLKSRKNVSDILQNSPIPATTLQAGIIIGSGSASFEIIRDLVEKLPLMIAPKWVENLCQPISIVDVLRYLTSALGNKKCYNQVFDIGGPDILSYREMLMHYAEARKLKRYIIGVPFLTPRLSSYWLFFVTSVNLDLAKALVESLKNNAICRDFSINKVIPRKCLSFKEALKLTFKKIEEGVIISSWKDSMAISTLHPTLFTYIKVPEHGCLIDVQKVPFKCPEKKVKEAVFAIGGTRGWYYMHCAWEIRGFIDKLFHGVGLRRGRTHPTRLRTGDALDFWRTLLADEENKRLLLYAEMRLPGEAWLEFYIEKSTLIQTATFRPHGILGRLYWYGIYPFHILIFRGMAKSIVKFAEKESLL